MADDLHNPGSLYDRDIVAWSEQQAVALRARKGGDNALDYDNLAEEIEDVGKSEQRACRSFVERIIEHLLKLQFVDSSDDRAHWRGEILAFRNSLEDALTPTIRSRLPAELPDLTARQIKVLARKEILTESAAVEARLGDGYDWAQITDPDWYPPTDAG